MAAKELIEFWAAYLEAERLHLVEREQDAPIVAMQGRLVQTTGGLHLYEFLVPSGVSLAIDLPVSVVSDHEAEATEGTVLRQTGTAVLVLLFDSFGKEVSSATLIPDQAGLCERSATRLKEILAKPDHYHLGPAERLASLLQADTFHADQPPPSSSVLTTVWGDDRSLRRQKLANMVMELIRANKRILLLSPDHQESDEITSIIARTMKTGGLNYKTWISRYEWPVRGPINGIELHELGFEAQMHQFYAKSQAEKASLRSKYERYRELAARLRAAIPGVQLGADIICGFPGETDDDHAATRQLMADLRFSQAFVFRYSPRPDTPAWGRLPDDVPEEVKHARLLELQALLGPIEEGQRIVAVPGADSNVPLWILGSSLYGAQLAAMLGLPYAFASHFAPNDLLPALEVYRAKFKPSAQLRAPYAMAGVHVVAADTDAEARHLFTSAQQNFTNMVRNRRGKLQPPIDDIETYWSPMEKAQASGMLRYAIVGGPATIRRGLDEFVALTGVDEMMVVCAVYDHAARKQSYAILASEGGLRA